MRVIYLNLVFLFTSEIKKVYSLSPPGSRNPGVAKPPSKCLNSRQWSDTSRASSGTNKPSSGTSGYLCDKKKVNDGAPDAHAVCNTKCLDLQTEIKNVHRAYPDHSTITYFYNKCGLVTEGICDFWGIAPNPICYCITPDGMRSKERTPLFLCRLGIPIIRSLSGGVDQQAGEIQEKENTNEEILPTELTRVRTKSSINIVDGENEKKEPEKEDDEQRPGELLVIEMLIIEMKLVGETTTKVQAVVDTGSAVTMINHKLAKYITPFNKKRVFRGASNVKFQIFGTTTLRVRSNEGIVFDLEGIVTNHHFDILIGNDFNRWYGTKINFPEKSMSFIAGCTKIKIPFKFIPGIELVSSIVQNFTKAPPLRVLAKVNTHKTIIMIDTGATRSVVNKAYVKSKNIRQSNKQLYVNDDTKFTASGKTDVTVLIGGTEFNTPALVLEFRLPNNLILGNTFIEHFVEIIDFRQKTVTFIPFGNNDRTVAPMIGFRED